MPATTLAAVGDLPYKVFFLLHILSVVVAFSPLFVRPVLTMATRVGGTPLPDAVTTQLERATRLVYGPALVLAGIFGAGLVGFSDDVYEMSETWVSIAFVLWMAMIAVVYLVQLPSERRVAAGEVAAAGRASMAVGILHGLFLLILIDMIWKPFR